jgi:hypothetical protein
MRAKLWCGNLLENVPWECRQREKDKVQMDDEIVGCKNGRWIELAQDHAHWRALALPR